MRVMRIAGLDLSTKTGVATINTGALESAPFFEAPFSKEVRAYDHVDNIDRAYQIALAVRDIFLLQQVDLVIIEGYSFAAKGRAVTILAEISAIVRMELIRESRPYLLVQPTTLKKFVTGRGNAKKDELRLAVYKRWGVEASTDNEIDAFGLAFLGAAMCNRLPAPTQASQDALDTVKKSNEYNRLAIDAPDWWCLTIPK